MLELYKRTYEPKLKKFPHKTIMKETDFNFQWISNRIKSSLEEFRNDVGGSGKIKILKIEPSTYSEFYDTVTVELIFDISFRFRSNDKSTKKNIHNVKISIKTDVDTMRIDIAAVERELDETIGNIQLNQVQLWDPLYKHSKMSHMVELEWMKKEDYRV